MIKSLILVHYEFVSYLGGHRNGSTACFFLNRLLVSQTTKMVSLFHKKGTIFLDEENFKRTSKRSRIKPTNNEADSSDNDDNKSSHFFKALYPDKNESYLVKSVKENLIKKQHFSSESDDSDSSKFLPNLLN